MGGHTNKIFAHKTRQHKTMKCSSCNQNGHRKNMRVCPNYRIYISEKEDGTAFWNKMFALATQKSSAKRKAKNRKTTKKNNNNKKQQTHQQPDDWHTAQFRKIEKEIENFDCFKVVPRSNEDSEEITSFEENSRLSAEPNHSFTSPENNTPNNNNITPSKVQNSTQSTIFMRQRRRSTPSFNSTLSFLRLPMTPTSSKSRTQFLRLARCGPSTSSSSRTKK